MAGSGQGVQTQDIIKVSATSGLTPAPQARDHKVEVAKLIDVSTCIGCKACQVGCSEWNDIRSDVNAQCVGIYDNPVDLNAKAWTVMRFNEVEENDRLEWLIRKDGCMHCSEPGCLKACPADRKSTRLNSSHEIPSRMPSSAWVINSIKYLPRWLTSITDTP